VRAMRSVIGEFYGKTGQVALPDRLCVRLYRVAPASG
jgi:hypothetical protein